MSESLAVLATAQVADAIERSADPAIAGAVLTRVVEAQPDIAGELRDDERVRNGLVAVAVASRSLANAVVNDRSVLDGLRDPTGFTTEHTVESLRAAWSRARAIDGDEPARTLRRWKRRELFRIAARDLLGVADLAVVGRELAALAEVCLGAALDLTNTAIPLTVIGMGKLGGQELNYASDVDVLFVHEGATDEADRVARALLATMTAPTADGIVFRTDADLRPEGRSGRLSRSLDAFAAYYERWAQTWELQSLIKARPVAGDLDLGSRFLALVEPHVWPEVLDPDTVREVRAMKARSEQILRRKGLVERELKRGRGGIRDIEFAVQLLQLVHGRHDPTIRSATTLLALGQLTQGGYVAHEDARVLGDAYRFLRTVEHRLQLVDEQQTHTLPADLTAQTRLARVLGYRDRGDESSLEQFQADHRAHQSAVRSIHERLFFQPLLEAFAGAGPLSAAAAEERLAAFGFLDATRTRAALQELTRGLTRRSRLMQQLLPLMFEWLSAAPDPDLGLLQLRRLAEGRARSSSLATTFRDSPGAAERICRLLGSSRIVGDALRHQPDFVDTLGDDLTLSHEGTRDELVAEALETLEWRTSAEGLREGLRRFKRRQLLRIASRDLLGFATIESTGRELAALADACVVAALRSLEPGLPFTVIGMGHLGGCELSYSSDIDVLFVYDGESPADFDAAERVATRLMQTIGATTAEGQTFRIDANLRPEGKQGPLARSLDGYRAYYERWALAWEFQSLIKARFVAGDAELAEQFLALVAPRVYRDHLPADDVREVRRIKARVERERIPPGEDPQFHLKLGRGSLSDVEFTVQLLQLIHGGTHHDVRVPTTIDALEALADAGLIARDDATILTDAYRFCERARNYRHLLTGTPGDSLPSSTVEAQRLGRMLGYLHLPQATLRDDYRRLTRRARAVVERVFYGQT